MYDPYDSRAQRRAQRAQFRAQRNYNRYQNPMRGMAGAIVIIALIISFAIPGLFNGSGFLVLLFVGLAFFSLLGSASTMNRNTTYGGLHGFCWFLGLALCFIIGFWPWILLPVAATMLLGVFASPVRNGLGGFMAMPQNQPPLYQQPGMQQATPGYQPYQQGYQGAQQQPSSYQEGGQQYPYTPTPNQQYEQPQVSYPEQQQEMPPMEQ